MLKSFFFIPSNKPKYILNYNKLKANYIVFDLEDSILEEEFSASLNNLADIKPNVNHFARIRLWGEKNDLNEMEFGSLLKMGFRKFVFPKFKSITQAIAIQKYLESENIIDTEFLILVESPIGLINILNLLQSNILNITGLGLGSHDYCNSMNMKHSNENLHYARHTLLNIAKAFNLDIIDTVFLEFENDVRFQNECIDAFNMGFTGKFLIHPRQLKLMNELEYYSTEEIQEAEDVLQRILEIKNNKNPIFHFKGKIYEKPHIDRILAIINWRNQNATK